MQSQSKTLALWPDGVPNQKSHNVKQSEEYSDILRIKDVVNPEIEVFLPSKKMATGDAVVICPGGGYYILAYDLEGTDIAKYLNAKGIAAIVLKYRMPSSDIHVKKEESALMDVQRAIRLTRHDAEEWNINPDRIGVMGFSAGGHLAACASTMYDRSLASAYDDIQKESARPDFSILVYPVISFTKPYGHTGSRMALSGGDDTIAEAYSPDLHITADTPPAILIHAGDDKSVPVQNSISYYEGLLQYNVSSSMHVYPHGGHGFGLAVDQNVLSSWPDRCVEWLAESRIKKEQ